MKTIPTWFSATLVKEWGRQKHENRPYLVHCNKIPLCWLLWL